MGQQIGCHKGAVAVPAHADSLGVDDAHGIQLVYGGLEAGDDLFDKGVIHGFRVTDDRHLRPVKECVSLRHIEELGCPSEKSEAVW